MDAQEFQERLENAVVILRKELCEIPHDQYTAHLKLQLFRSTTSVALNYAEAQEASFLRDFVHKTRICLKEVKESQVCARLLQKMCFVDSEGWKAFVSEMNQIVAMFVSTVKTAFTRLNKESKKYRFLND